LTDIVEARAEVRRRVDRMAEAHFDGDEDDYTKSERRARTALRQAQTAVRQSPDLTKADAVRIIHELKKEYDAQVAEIGSYGLAAKGARSLTDLMQGAMSVEQALQVGMPTLDEIWEEEDVGIA
jgi:hypothetical protein